jgi:hypothetical protein
MRNRSLNGCGAVTLTEAERTNVVRLVDEAGGWVPAARKLQIARNTLYTAALGSPVRLGTATLIRLGIGRARS